MATRTPSIRPGELTVSQLEVHESTVKSGAPLPEWVAVADHVIDRLPAITAKLGGVGPGGHTLLQWVAIVALAVGLVMHVVGDGTVREEAKKTNRLVEWLVRRAIAEDNGEPPPPFDPSLL